MAVIVLVLLLTTLPLSFFGIDDFLHALTFPGRVTGTVLIAVALATLLGAAAALDHWLWRSFPYSGVVALIGAFAAFLTNLFLLVETTKDGDSTIVPALFAALTAGSVWAVYAVWRTSVVIPAPKRVAVALIVSSVIAIANFGYQNLYQPYQRETRPLLKLSTGKPDVSQDGKAFAVPVDITFENHGTVGFYVLGTEFHAMAEHVPLSKTDRLREQWRTDAEQWANSQEINPLSRREIHQPGQLVQAQPWMDPGVWIDPGDVFSMRVVVQLPIDTPYDQLAMYASASLARKDQLDLEPPLQFKAYSWKGSNVPVWVKKQEKNGLDTLVYQARVHENNAIDEFTREPRYVSVYWEFGAHGSSVLSAVAPQGEEDHKVNGEEQKEVISRYGLVDVLAGPVERTLWDIKSRQ
ncbi:hypothetical protein GCM10014715_46080 [Streptomyces spiralis]|uniref:Uncharacterized protein n=1 Tax=Streptomyces spiralis TaxID=66376 RepID=A0A919A332_9ACTN|nr:hypothetical protein [Streptomyces spiralis]GHE84709.1 hypothetical protein GCM10014715_46080 [Streptomyces spiralis]